MTCSTDSLESDCGSRCTGFCGLNSWDLSTTEATSRKKGSQGNKSECVMQVMYPDFPLDLN